MTYLSEDEVFQAYQWFPDNHKWFIQNSPRNGPVVHDTEMQLLDMLDNIIALISVCGNDNSINCTNREKVRS